MMKMSTLIWSQNVVSEKNKDQNGIYSMLFLHKKLKKIRVYMYDVYIFKKKLWKDKPKTKESSYLYKEG